MSEDQFLLFWRLIRKWLKDQLGHHPHPLLGFLQNKITLTLKMLNIELFFIPTLLLKQKDMFPIFWYIYENIWPILTRTAKNMFWKPLLYLWGHRKVDLYATTLIYSIKEAFYHIFMSLNEFFDPKNGKIDICFIIL